MTIPLDPERAEKGLYWDRAWSLVQGCTPVSAACDHCWAASQAHMRASNPNAKVAAANAGLTVLSGDRKGAFNGNVRFNADALDIPCRTRKPQVWAVWTDLFHEQVREQDIHYAIEDMHEATHHTFIVLTKRPERMRQFDMRGDNIIVGVTAEDQDAANERIPHLLATEATYRMVSVEPMLGAVDLERWLRPRQTPNQDGYGGDQHPGWTTDLSRVNWVVCGGETGPGARPMHPEWARSIRDECQAAGVPFWFKSWGAVTPREQWARGENDHGAGRQLDGKVWKEKP